MAKLGSEENPLILTVRDSEFAEQIAKSCHEKDWYFIMEVNPLKPEDISDFEKKMYPPTVQYDDSKMGRNEPCHCGSGKKYKKCCPTQDLQLQKFQDEILK